MLTFSHFFQRIGLFREQRLLGLEANREIVEFWRSVDDLTRELPGIPSVTNEQLQTSHDIAMLMTDLSVTGIANPDQTSFGTFDTDTDTAVQVAVARQTFMRAHQTRQEYPSGTRRLINNFVTTQDGDDRAGNRAAAFKKVMSQQAITSSVAAKEKNKDQARKIFGVPSDLNFTVVEIPSRAHSPWVIRIPYTDPFDNLSRYVPAQAQSKQIELTYDPDTSFIHWTLNGKSQSTSFSPDMLPTLYQACAGKPAAIARIRGI